MSYALLLAPLLVVAAASAVLALRRDRAAWAALALGAVVVLALTVVFDSLMIAVDLFRFDESLLLGLRVGLAPVEDLGYALVAVLLVVTLWRVLPSRDRRRGAKGSGSARAAAGGGRAGRPGSGRADA